jgi:hypothetical protein
MKALHACIGMGCAEEAIRSAQLGLLHGNGVGLLSPRPLG